MSTVGGAGAGATHNRNAGGGVAENQPPAVRSNSKDSATNVVGGAAAASKSGYTKANQLVLMTQEEIKKILEERLQ